MSPFQNLFSFIKFFPPFFEVQITRSREEEVVQLEGIKAKNFTFRNIALALPHERDDISKRTISPPSPPSVLRPKENIFFPQEVFPKNVHSLLDPSGTDSPFPPIHQIFSFWVGLEGWSLVRMVGIVDKSHYHHYRRWCTLFNPVSLLA